MAPRGTSWVHAGPQHVCDDRSRSGRGDGCHRSPRHEGFGVESNHLSPPPIQRAVHIRCLARRTDFAERVASGVQTRHRETAPARSRRPFPRVLMVKQRVRRPPWCVTLTSHEDSVKGRARRQHETASRAGRRSLLPGGQQRRRRRWPRTDRRSRSRTPPPIRP